MSCAWIILKPSPCSWSMEKMSSTKLPWCQKGWQPLPVIIYICTFLQTSPPQLCEVLHSVVEHCPQYLRSPFLREGLWGDILKLSEILIKGLISHMHAQLLSHVWLFATPWPAKLLCPWNFPGKNSGVGCHFLLQGKNRHTDKMEKNRNPEINPHLYGQFIMKEPRIYNGKRTVSSINGAGETS